MSRCDIDNQLNADDVEAVADVGADDCLFDVLAVEDGAVAEAPQNGLGGIGSIDNNISIAHRPDGGAQPQHAHLLLRRSDRPTALARTTARCKLASTLCTVS